LRGGGMVGGTEKALADFSGQFIVREERQPAPAGYNTPVFTRFVPPLVLQLLLIAVIVGVVLIGLRAVVRARRERRTAPLPELSPDETAALTAVLPRFETVQRVTAPVIRLLPPVPGSTLPPVIEIRYAKKPLSFTPADFFEPGVGEQYRAALLAGAKQTVDLALYALCTLAEGGADAMRAQIRDFDKVKEAENAVRFLPAQTQLGDYVVIGRILSHRRDDAGDPSEPVPVIAYRAEVIRTEGASLVIELAVPDEGQTPFKDGAMVHGTARVYGYLA